MAIIGIHLKGGIQSVKITVESESAGMVISTQVEVPSVEASGEELEWLASTFKHLVEEGILGSRS